MNRISIALNEGLSSEDEDARMRILGSSFGSSPFPIQVSSNF
ncbi:MAG: hypothetical protein WCK85_12975 [Chlorobium sp.]